MKSKEDKAYLKSCTGILPKKCDCGEILQGRNFKVLRCGKWPVYLEVICDCDQNWLIDTEGVSFRIVEY